VTVTGRAREEEAGDGDWVPLRLTREDGWMCDIWRATGGGGR
jgi:hypothetical protein